MNMLHMHALLVYRVAVESVVKL
uniref:Uncharacterized protein n=1 Tax=Anguilla anguilla TaxID=7936 RepID=A0A0E9VWL5_ANGAN